MTAPILIVNPNSSRSVTEGIRETVAPLASSSGITFEVTDIPSSPATISTDEDVVAAGKAFLELISHRPDAGGFVTACFSDPGLDLARAAVPQPVTGAQEAAILAAVGAAERFGIIALSERAIPRHLRRIEAMGFASRLAAELALPDISAEASGRDPEAYRHLATLGRRLRDEGAGAVVLGCAGMAAIRERLASDIGIPVIDPVIASAELALSRSKGSER